MDLDVISTIWLATVLLAILIGLFVILIFKSDQVINLLRLDKGFDDDRIEFGNMNSRSLLKLAMIIIGGLLILDNIPEFLWHTLFAFQAEIDRKTHDSMYKFQWAVSGVNLMLGLLLLTNYNALSMFIFKK